MIPNAGFGLFTGKKRIRGTSLGLYTGRRIRNKKLDKYYPETGLASYAICKSGRDDALCINVSYSNHKKSLRHTNMNIQDVGKKEKFTKSVCNQEHRSTKRNILLLWKKIIGIIKIITKSRNIVNYFTLHP